MKIISIVLFVILFKPSFQFNSYIKNSNKSMSRIKKLIIEKYLDYTYVFNMDCIKEDINKLYLNKFFNNLQYMKEL